jgi:hypothetical protein
MSDIQFVCMIIISMICAVSVAAEFMSSAIFSGAMLAVLSVSALCDAIKGKSQ